jgi:hypothetical protein
MDCHFDVVKLKKNSKPVGLAAQSYDNSRFKAQNVKGRTDPNS